MNIFVIDQKPAVAAKGLHPKHVVKMILESCQMLAVASPFNLYTKRSEATAFHLALLTTADPVWLALLEGSDHFDAWGRKPFSKKAHLHHPCTRWVRSSPDNYEWLRLHAIALCKRYERLYGKQHGLLRGLLRIPPQGDWRNHTPFVRAMPEDLKGDSSLTTPQAYRLYLLKHKPW